MVTDRFSTMILCAILSSLYPLASSAAKLDATSLKTLAQTLLPGVGLEGVRSSLVQGLSISNDQFLAPLLVSPYLRDILYFFMVLDLVSHWYHMYASLLTGAGSHKAMNTKGNVFIRLYYTNRTMLFLCCACQELFWMSLYMRANAAKIAATTGLAAPGMMGLLSHVFLLISTPLFVFKQFMNVLQMKKAMDSIMEYEAGKIKVN